jgi:hypothetical protein
MVSDLFPAIRNSEDQLLLSYGLLLLSLAFLVSSWFPENPAVRRFFENASLVTGAFFFRAFALSESWDWVPLGLRLLFPGAFAFLLYLKLINWFSR